MAGTLEARHVSDAHFLNDELLLFLMTGRSPGRLTVQLRCCIVSGFIAFAAPTGLAQEAPAGETPAGETPPDETPAGETPPGETPAAAQPILVPPRLLDAPAIELPAGETEEIPPEGASVLLQVTIQPDGTVSEAEVVEGIGATIDEAVLAAAQNMRFEPATRDGVAIPATVQFRYRVASAVPEDAAASEGSSQDTPAEEHTPSATSPIPPNPFEDPAPEDVARFSASGILLDDETGDTRSSDGRGGLVFGAAATVDFEESGAATKITLTGDELLTVPGTFGEPLRVVATLPGVARTPFGLGFFFVRGASFQNTGFFVDGFQVPLLYHLAAGPAVINSRLVKELSFYPGGYPASYGRFSAGVIAVETAAPDVETVHLEAEIDFLRASALAIIPFDEGRGVLSASFRRSYYELILPLIVDDVDISYADWQLRADYALTPKIDTSLFYFGSQDDFDVSASLGAGVGDEQTRTGLRYGFHRLIGSVSARLPEDIRLKWSATVGVDQTSLGQTDPGGSDVSTDITGTYLGQRLELFVPATEQLHTTVGIDALATLYNAETTLATPPGIGEAPRPIPDPSSTVAIVDPLVVNAAPYIEQVFRFDPVEITTALRFDYLRYGNVSKVFVDPRAVVRYHPIEELTIKAASGLFTQPPQPFEIDNIFGNPSLSPTRAWQSSAGVELDLPENIYIESQGFYSQMFDLPRATNGFANDENDPTRRELFVADGEGRSYGFEFLLRREADEGFYGWLSYTLSWSERFVEGGQVVPFFFDQRHTLNFVLSYAVDGWRFGARMQLSSGRPSRPVLGCEEDLDADRCVQLRGGLTDRLPTYHQLDIRIDREFDFGEHFRGSVYLDLLNVYNAQNSEGFIFQWDSRGQEPLPGLPILGTLGVRLEYE